MATRKKMGLVPWATLGILSIGSIGVPAGGAPTRSASEIEINAVPSGPDSATRSLLLALAHERLDGSGGRSPSESRILSVEFSSASKGAESEFRIVSYHSTSARYHELRGNLSNPSAMIERTIEPLAPPPPSPEEFDDAVLLLRKDAELGSKEWEPYMAMPGIDSEEPGRRVVTIGLRPRQGSSFDHEIVGVDLERGKIKRYPSGAPSGAIATQRMCAPPDAYQWVTGQGWAGQSRIEVKKGNETLWNFTAIRPSASSGARGSGIELREIYYRGNRIAGALHAPILNVRYVGNVCGPYRDWTYAESAFEAQGEAMTTGFIRASTKPSTIFESGNDDGNFRGVAVYRDGADTVLVSEMEAGWYRYKSEYRLSDDGTIRPIWGFTGVQSSCTCHNHVHHGYFRMDLDLSAGNGAHDVVQYFDGSQWQAVEKEASFVRDSAHRLWRVLDPVTGRGIEITPGEHDGSADDYGVADIWALAHHSNEIDDSAVTGATQIGLDAFLNNENLYSSDVVLWYGVHFRHLTDNLPIRDNAELGPTLKPFQIR